MNRTVIHSKSESDTFDAGKKLASKLKLILSKKADVSEETSLFNSFGDDTAVVAIYGELGSGKTVFVRGMASVFAPDAFVQSPSYTIVNEYIGNDYNLYHFDMYRITGEDALFSIGFYDYSNAVLAIEWSEKIPYALPRIYWKVSFLSEGENDRKIEIEFIDSQNQEKL